MTKAARVIHLREADVMKGCTDVLRAYGYHVFRMQSMNAQMAWGGRRTVGERGMPDLLAIRYRPDGMARVIWIECKSPTGKLDERQKLWHECARTFGADVRVVREAKDLAEALKREREEEIRRDANQGR